MQRPTALIDCGFQRKDNNFPQIELYRFNSIPINIIPVCFCVLFFFVDIHKLMLNFIQRGTGLTTAKRILKRKVSSPTI